MKLRAKFEILQTEMSSIPYALSEHSDQSTQIDNYVNTKKYSEEYSKVTQITAQTGPCLHLQHIGNPKGLWL